MPDHVIGCVAHKTTCERHAGDLGPWLRCPAECAAESREQLSAILGNGTALSVETQTRSIQLQLEPRAESDERVTTQPLAALDTLEQEIGLERGKLHERRHRRIEIPRDVEWRFQHSTAPIIKKPIPA